ncbi:hypothetical protein J2W49_004514 [Hydrogenophaga palleronii]|uniref:Uncharacterized protein n=1 Tax=Hydrogenophaga palleronii TaxID=65655 RepID=A0ABU1WUC4_9BURK|nr:hypothetical protein [Hydrogenophaga palleronii]MDR7152536.1 hypothetical protein [Hydrogenophaga palleronii]
MKWPTCRLAPLTAALMMTTGLASAQTVLNVSTWLPPSHGATMAQNKGLFTLFSILEKQCEQTLGARP